MSVATVPAVHIAGHRIGGAAPRRTFVVAEISANHRGSLEEALFLVDAAHAAGVQAIKLQTYTPDTMTLDCDRPEFRLGTGTIWEGRRLHELYGEAHTPWAWHEPIARRAAEHGLVWFSTPFDATAVDFLEALGAPAYKIASFELVDHPLLEKVARTGKPVILSTGMASLDEIDSAVGCLRDAGCRELVLLKCTSAYPAPPESMNLAAMRTLAERYGVPAGLSDHTLGTAVPVAAVALGATLVEKHFTRSRALGGPDGPFSLEPAELKHLVDDVRVAELAIGGPAWAVVGAEDALRVFRRSLFVSRDVQRGEVLDDTNVRSIRPGHGLAPRHWNEIVGRRAARDLVRGAPLAWDDVAREPAANDGRDLPEDA